MQIEVVGGIDAVDPAAWDASAAPDDPFTRHAFLSALERSGSAAPDAGFAPAHLVLRGADGSPRAVAPVYLKGHSWGEYIFDQGWADAARRHRLPYYPKATAAVPFTPATGPRLRAAPGDDAARLALWEGLGALSARAGGGAWAVLFAPEAEARALAAADPRAILRKTYQFHWENAGYRDFDDWLSRFRSKSRKEARRERARPAELGVSVVIKEGAAITAADWAALEGFYRATVDKKWGQHYLTPDFFTAAADTLQAHTLAVLAVDAAGVAVAGALCFRAGRHLYGRHWGCAPGYEALHFELCYHAPIDLCITRGWSRFEAGAQGHHKLKRGLLPAATWSVHGLAHPGLRAAVAEAVAAETAAVDAEIASLAAHGPFPRDGGAE